MKYFTLFTLAIIAAGLFLPSCTSSTHSQASSHHEQINLKAISSLERVLSLTGSEIKIQGKNAAKIYSAQNETESFQIVITAGPKQLKNVYIEKMNLTSPKGNVISKKNIHLYREISVPIRNSSPKAPLGRGLYPDALVPFVNPNTNKPTKGGRFLPQGFTLWAGHHQPIWVDVDVPKNAEPGTYRGRMKVNADSVSSAAIQVELNVWDFTLPDRPTHSSSFGSLSRLASHYNTGNNSKRGRKIKMRYIDLLARHRLNPHVPEHLYPAKNDDGIIKVTEEFDQAFTAFITKYHVTTIKVPEAPYSIDSQQAKAMHYYRSWYRYLTKKGWASRAYVSLPGEPNSATEYREVREIGEKIGEAAPGLRRLVSEQTYTQNQAWGRLDEAVDIWCPLFGFINESSIARVKSQGDEVWTYTALIQGTPSNHPDYEDIQHFNQPHWEINFPLTSYRVPTWMNRRYDITGLLYWSIIFHGDRNPWDNPAFRGEFNGGGQLIYPGDEAGIDDGPAPSIRLKVLRDAMEDYEYFHLLDQKGQKKLVNKIVNEVVPTWGSWKQNPEIYRKMRKKMGEAISSGATTK